MAEDDVIGTVAQQAGEFAGLWQLVTASESLQVALGALVLGLLGIAVAYRKFSKRLKSRKISYARPHLSKFIMVLVMPLFAIALFSSINAYIQFFELFSTAALGTGADAAATETFARVLNSVNVLVVGYTVAQLIPIILNKRTKSILEQEDFASWRGLRGFRDDDGDLFHRLFRWNPPAHAPSEIAAEEFAEKLKTEEGRRSLEAFHTSKGLQIGSYTKLTDDPFEEWKKSERVKYNRYLEDCLSDNNESGRKLKMGQDPEEIYPIDTWREEKRIGGFGPIVAAYRPPGYAFKIRKDLPKSIGQILPIAIFAAVILGVVSSWGVDLFVLATATGGFAIGLGLALQETMQNWFAYIMIRKDKIVGEGDRIQLESGYNGYVHKITARVTYIRHGLNESFAIIPTRQLVSAQIVNYTKELSMVPAVVDVGVSYLNNPRGVAAILVKVGRRAMKEAIDYKGRHLVVQRRCPYLDESKPSCGCDKGIVVDIDHPVVRFNAFNDSSLDFSMWVYVRDFGSQFKVKTDLRMIMYEEFKKYDIRIPWPIRTIYQGDENREAEEIARLKDERTQVRDEYGYGDIGKGGDDE